MRVADIPDMPGLVDIADLVGIASLVGLVGLSSYTIVYIRIYRPFIQTAGLEVLSNYMIARSQFFSTVSTCKNLQISP